ncbi:MAG TPA: hypothetical protein VKG20_00860 [Methylomirabilota bacterium]|nr:hypothetical protein [Methylomirabilota bacterium]
MVARSYLRPLLALAVALLALAAGAGAASPGPWTSLLGPRQSFAPDVSAAVERVWSEPTLQRTLDGRPARVSPDVCMAFLEAPEVTAAAARFRHIARFEIQALDDDHYVASDGDGARGSAQVLRREPRRVVMLSSGEHTGPFLGTISGSALTILDVEPRRDTVNPKLVAYVYIDSPVAATLARALIPTFGFLADRKLGEGMRVTAEVAEWAIEPSGGFCAWLAREPLTSERRARILAAIPSCGVAPRRHESAPSQSP